MTLLTAKKPHCGTRYPERVKESARQMHADGMSYNEIGRILGIKHPTISRWCNWKPPEPIPTGPDHPNWKGDAASKWAGRVRAKKLYKLGPCELCGEQAVDRHHIDGNTLNNEPSNIQILCRRCHMVADGRLDTLRKLARENARKSIKPPQPCIECGHLAKPTRRGMCASCYTRSWEKAHPNRKKKAA